MILQGKRTHLFYYESPLNSYIVLFLWHDVPQMKFWVHCTTFWVLSFQLEPLLWELDIVSMIRHRQNLFCIHVFLYYCICLFCLFVSMYAQGFPYWCMLDGDHIAKLIFIQHAIFMNMRTVYFIHHVYRDLTKDLRDRSNMFFFSK